MVAQVGPLLFSIVNKVYFHILSWPVWCLLHKIQGTIIILKFGTPKLNNLKSFRKGNVWFYYAVMCLQEADGMANCVDPDQTAPRSSLIWFFTVCSDLSVLILRILW